MAPVLIAVLALPVAPPPARAATCEKQLVTTLRKLRKKYLFAQVKCLYERNGYREIGDCPDPRAQSKIDRILARVHAAVAGSCTMDDLDVLGLGPTCDLGGAPTGVQATCAALPTTTPDEWTDCLVCWTMADLAAFTALLYPSQALRVCGDALDATSPACSPMGCTDPLPTQHNLGPADEGNCQRGIGRAGTRYSWALGQLLETCAMRGRSQAECLADPGVQAQIAKKQLQLRSVVERECINRVPTQDPAYCCRCFGAPGMCVDVEDRVACLWQGCEIFEDQTCDVDSGACVPMEGSVPITWWAACPPVPGCASSAPQSTLADLMTCMETSAGLVIDTHVCRLFGARGWPCP